MKKVIVIAIVNILLLNIILPLKAQISDTDKEKVIYLMTDDKSIVSLNIETNYACATTVKNSVIKFAIKKIENLGNNYKQISGISENSLNFRTNRITKLTRKVTVRGRVYSANWLIENTNYYPESLYEMADCTTGRGLTRLRKSD